jgi:hypothetical protein
MDKILHIRGMLMNYKLKEEIIMSLIIYDNTGRVWIQRSGSYDVPVGLPYLEEEIPEGKYLVSVDVTGETPTPVFEDFPKSQELTRIELLETALNELILRGGE